MLQRATDATFLSVFSILYSLAVFVLKLRAKTSAEVVYRAGSQPQTQSV
jgi:hypothetical protein